MFRFLFQQGQQFTARMVKSEVVTVVVEEASLLRDRCAIWNPLKDHYDQLTTTVIFCFESEEPGASRRVVIRVLNLHRDKK